MSIQISPPSERFWTKVEKTDGCWRWKAARNQYGYGAFGVTHSDVRLAHRFAWELTHGPIAAGVNVLHRCDTPECVNPAHLFLGTQRDNMRDMAGKGRNNNQKKSHCKRGHPFDAENTVIDSQGARQCRACELIRRAVA